MGVERFLEAHVDREPHRRGVRDREQWLLEVQNASHCCLESALQDKDRFTIMNQNFAGLGGDGATELFTLSKAP